MNLLFLSSHCCIRVLKEAAALQERGHSITFLHQRVANADLVPCMGAMTFWDNDDTLAAKLNACAGKYDAIHVHNEPTWLVSAARECCPQDTIILDAHDLDMCRNDRLSAEEAAGLLFADGVIVPSGAYKREVIATAKYSGPVAEVRSYVPRETLNAIKRAPAMPPLQGLLYEGNATPNHRLGYTDYRALAAHCKAAGIPLYMAASDHVNPEVYQDNGAVVIPPQRYGALLSSLHRYGYGACGAGKLPCRQWELTLPNKLFEYVACGLPVVSWPRESETSRLVVAHGIGEAFASFADITADVWSRLLARRERYAAAAAELRERWTMDDQTANIESLYAAAKAWHDGAPTRKHDLPALPERGAVSVVVATLNRFELLPQLVHSVRRSVAGRAYEIVVVDGGSTDATRAWCRAQSDVVLIEQDNKAGCVAAYNAGFMAARGEFVAHLNDDCEVVGPIIDAACGALECSPYLAQIILPFADPGQAPHTDTCGHWVLRQKAWAYANFGVTRKSAGDAVGWWGDYAHHAGDAELSMQLHARRLGVGYVPEIPGYVKHLRVHDATRKKENVDRWTFWRRWEWMLGPAPQSQGATP